MVANTGTYLDSPFHRYQEGEDLANLALESLACLEGIVVRHVGRAERELERARFPNIETNAGNPYGPDDRRITAASLEHLDVNAKAALSHCLGHAGGELRTIQTADIHISARTPPRFWQKRELRW